MRYRRIKFVRTRLLHEFVTFFAFVGIILIIGTVGTSDIISHYPIRFLIKRLIVGVIMMAPAVYREISDGTK